MQEIYSAGLNWRSDFYNQWQLHKQLKNMEKNEIWLDIYIKGYTHKFQPGTQNSVTKAKAPSLKMHVFL